MKRRILCALLSAMMIVSFTACSAENLKGEISATTAQSSADASSTDLEVNAEEVTDGDYDLSFSKRDLDSSYDESEATKITFTNSSAESSSSSATVSGTTVTITDEGTYIISGTCSDGKIVIETDNSNKVQVVLDGLNLTSSGSPFVVKSADKVFLTLADGSENTITDASSYTETIDDTNVDAAIFSKDDLTINGSGTLTVNGNYKHGIVSKDDLVIADSTVNVTSASTAIEGKDSVKIKDAEITVNAGSDGIRSTNIDETDTKGFVYINSGTINITSNNDAIQSSSLLRIDGGNFTITTGGGSASGKTHTENNFRMDMFSSSSDSEDSESAKAIKSADSIKLNGGTFTIDSSDDAIHSNNTVEIENGNFEIQTGDDGVHADNTLVIDGGTVDITKSYEGIEAGEITVNDGTISVVSGDDGFNAAGGDGSNMQDMFSSDASKKLIINGGYIYVDSDGDGLDSNGSIEITGGTVLVSGPQDSGNGALDYDSSATITGGTLIAIGSSGMAEAITGSGQCSIMTDITAQSGGTSCALVDSSGNVIASFTASKQYTNVVFSTPDIKTGETYTIVCGGSVSGADEHGYTSSGTVSGGTSVTEITMDSENYSNGGGMMGGGFGGGQMGGQPGGDRGGFGGQQDNRGGFGGQGGFGG